MLHCKVSKYMAYLMLAYCLASVYYLIRSRSIGTPFNDSLTDAQKIIKARSSKQRRNIFIRGIVISLIILVIFKPFEEC